MDVNKQNFKGRFYGLRYFAGRELHSNLFLMSNFASNFVFSLLSVSLSP
jgi:hypothetical protein